MPDVVFNPGVQGQGGTFDMQSLEAFANQNDNSKLLVSNSGEVSIKNAFTSRLPGTAQARLNAAAAFLNTIKQTYGEEVANRLAQDSQFASALRGKPLSSHRVKAILDKANSIADQINHLHRSLEVFATDETARNSDEFQKLTKMAKELDAYWEKKPLSTNDFSALNGQYGNATDLPAGFQHILNSTIANHFASLGCSIKQGSDQFNALQKTFYVNILQSAIRQAKLPNNELKPSDFKTIIDTKLDRLTHYLFESVLKSQFEDYSQVVSEMLDIGIKNTMTNDAEVSAAFKNLPETKKFDEFVALLGTKLSAQYEVAKTFDTKLAQYMDTIQDELAQKSGVPKEEIKEAMSHNKHYKLVINSAKSSIRADVNAGNLKLEDIENSIKAKTQKIVDVFRTSTDFINQLNISASAKKYLCLEQLYAERRVNGIVKDVISIIDQHPSFGEKIGQWQGFFNQINQAQTQEQIKAILLENSTFLSQVEQDVISDKKIVDFIKNGGEFGGEEVNMQRQMMTLKLISSNLQLPDSEKLGMMFDMANELTSASTMYFNLITTFSEVYDHAFLNGPYKS